MDDWKTQLPEELQGNETLNRFNGVEDLAKSYLEARSTIGSSIRVPSAEAGKDAMNTFVNDLVAKAPNVMIKPDFSNPEQMTGFYKTLGVPDEATGYTAPEGVEMSEELAENLRNAAFDLKLTDQQYQQFAKSVAEDTQAQVQQAESSFKEGHDALKAEWGAAYEKNKKAAEKIFKDHAVSGDFDQMNAEGVRSFYNISKAMLGDGPQVEDQPGIPDLSMTPDEAQNQINEILNNKDHPYWNVAAEGHQAAQKKMMDLQAYKMGMEPPERYDSITSLV